MADSIWTDLEKRVGKLCGTKIAIAAGDEIYRNLHLDGDDAWDFLEGIHQDYGVDFTGFDFDRYFPNEAESIYYFYGRWLGLWRNRFKPLTVAHLVAVIERGRWFDPPLEAEIGR